MLPMWLPSIGGNLDGICGGCLQGALYDHADSYPSTSSSLTHRASPFWKEKLKAVQQQLSDASGEEDPTCNSIA